MRRENLNVVGRYEARRWVVGGLLVSAFLLAVCGAPCAADTQPLDVSGWDRLFTFRFDYELAERTGLERRFEPVEVTLSVPAEQPATWRDHIRVVKLESEGRGVVAPHQIMGTVRAVAAVEGNRPVAAPVESVNIVFLASCAARGKVTYRLFWGMRDATTPTEHIPSAQETSGLGISGEAPGLEVRNEYYTANLDPKSGALARSRIAGGGEQDWMFYRSVPMHFGVDAWSPPQGWDHDYDWTSPPNHRVELGPLVARYHRWGPMQNYPDVVVSITYTFYAHVPYIHVSSTMEFTKERSARAVRIGEIVVSHTHRAGPDERDADGKSPDVFTHYAWPTESGAATIIEVNAHRDEEGRANLEGVAPGTLAILDRDVPWVAGYHADRAYGMASLRRAQFAGNRLGNPVPYTVPCTYVANYGWGFTYWSRPVVYPYGMRTTPEDQNTAIAAGTLFAAEEALLFFKPDPECLAVREAHRRFTAPLRLQFKGTGPW